MKYLANALLLISTIAVVLVSMEIGLRFVYLSNPFTTRNFIADPVDQVLTNQAIIGDSLLGYSLRPGWEGGSYGVRVGPPRGERQTGRFADATVGLPQEAAIVVGDSFAFASEVRADRSWAWQLERLTGAPIVNGGAGGYGFDQAYLRAVQLAEIVKPTAFIMACIPNCVSRDEYAVNGGLPKPYYQIEGGQLKLANMPVPAYRPGLAHIGALRHNLGSSYLAFWVAERLGHRDKWVVSKYEYLKGNDNGAQTACLLMSKLGDLAKKHDAPAALLMQYSGMQIAGIDDSRKSYKVPHIMECAQKAGVHVVDTYPHFRAIFDSEADSLWAGWIRHPGNKPPTTSGHMSTSGNLITACIVAATLSNVEEMPFYTASTVENADCVPTSARQHLRQAIQ